MTLHHPAVPSPSFPLAPASCRALCYACEAPVTGARDFRPEGGTLAAACLRHADTSTQGERIRTINPFLGKGGICFLGLVLGRHVFARPSSSALLCDDRVYVAIAADGATAHVRPCCAEGATESWPLAELSR